MSLDILYRRLLRTIPEEYHKEITKEFDKYEIEKDRMSEDEDKVGQATLTEREIKRAETTNQHGKRGHTVVQLQSIKAAAMKHNIDNWLQYVDPELSVRENKEIMQRKGSPTAKQLKQWK